MCLTSEEVLIVRRLLLVEPSRQLVIEGDLEESRNVLYSRINLLKDIPEGKVEIIGEELSEVGTISSFSEIRS